MTGTFHPTGITISSYLVQTNTAGMGSLITSHNATEEKTGTGSSQKKEQGSASPQGDLKVQSYFNTSVKPLEYQDEWRALELNYFRA